MQRLHAAALRACPYFADARITRVGVSRAEAVCRACLSSATQRLQGGQNRQHTAVKGVEHAPEAALVAAQARQAPNHNTAQQTAALPVPKRQARTSAAAPCRRPKHRPPCPRGRSSSRCRAGPVRIGAAAGKARRAGKPCLVERVRCARCGPAWHTTQSKAQRTQHAAGRHGEAPPSRPTLQMPPSQLWVLAGQMQLLVHAHPAPHVACTADEAGGRDVARLSGSWYS